MTVRVLGRSTGNSALTPRSSKITCSAQGLASLRRNRRVTGFPAFTLYHNPTRGGPADFWESTRDKLGLRTDVTRLFVDILGDTQRRGKPVHWLAHSQGGIIFSQAVRDYVEKGLYRGRQLLREERRLDKLKVIYDGAAVHVATTDALMKKAGIESKHWMDPADPVYQIAGGNALRQDDTLYRFNSRCCRIGKRTSRAPAQNHVRHNK